MMPFWIVCHQILEGKSGVLCYSLNWLSTSLVPGWRRGGSHQNFCWECDAFSKTFTPKLNCQYPCQTRVWLRKGSLISRNFLQLFPAFWMILSHYLCFPFLCKMPSAEGFYIVPEKLIIGNAESDCRKLSLFLRCLMQLDLRLWIEIHTQIYTCPVKVILVFTCDL